MNKITICILFVILAIATQAQNRRSSTTTKASSSKSKSKPAVDNSEVETTKSKSTSTSKSKTKKVAEEAPAEESTSKSQSTASGTSFWSPKSAMSKMSTTIEFGAYPSDADLTLINIYGHLGLNFDLSRQVFIGPYFKHKIMSTHEYQVMDIEGKSLEVASFNEWGGGLSFGAYFPIGSAILLTPELRVGYNEYNMQDTSYTSTNKNFLNHKYLSAQTRMNIGFKVGSMTVFNLSGGYILPYYLSGNKTAAYDPGTFMYGVGLKFYMQGQ